MNRPIYPNRIGGIEIVRLPGWAMAIGAVVAGALGLAVFLASASLILMLAPVIIGVGFYVRWRVRRALRQMAEAQRSYPTEPDVDIIDVEYQVVEDEKNRRHR